MSESKHEPGRGKPGIAAAISLALSVVPAILLAQAGPAAGHPGHTDASTSSTSSETWQADAARIPGIVDFRGEGIEFGKEHDWAPLNYQLDPPVGGTHNPVWQQCMGNVYDWPIASEHAVHSLEHGAVWLAYHSELDFEEVDVLASKVAGKPYTFMAPYDNLDSVVSLQAWGYQLKVDDVHDPRIDEFIRVLAKNASIEPGATCTGGNTATGTTPLTEDETYFRLILGGRNLT